MSAISESIGETTGGEFFETNESLKKDSLESKTFSISVSIFNYFFPKHPYTNHREFRFIPNIIEEFIGALSLDEHIDQRDNINEGQDYELCQKIFLDLKNQSKRKEVYHTASIKNTARENAYSIPGGYMILNRGLLDKIDHFLSHKNEMGLNGYVDPETGRTFSYENVTKKDIVAALIGHEMIHAELSHSMKKLEQQIIYSLSYPVGLLFCAIKLGSFMGVLASIGSTIVLGGAVDLLAIHYFNKLSKAHEYEADRLGVLNAVKAGYHSHGAFFLQAVLHDAHIVNDDDYNWITQAVLGVIKFFTGDTHPTYEERQKAHVAFIEKHQLLADSKPTTLL
ncbi:MAG: M48 family metalloprotease [Simkaniaceae bacterium]|nr:M48 family metalloprotease [Simkaniaceae bacterium]